MEARSLSKHTLAWVHRSNYHQLPHSCWASHVIIRRGKFPGTYKALFLKRYNGSPVHESTHPSQTNVSSVFSLVVSFKAQPQLTIKQLIQRRLRKEVYLQIKNWDCLFGFACMTARTRRIEFSLQPWRLFLFVLVWLSFVLPRHVWRMNASSFRRFGALNYQNLYQKRRWTGRQVRSARRFMTRDKMFVTETGSLVFQVFI